MSLEGDASCLGPQQTGDSLQGGGLAGPVGADQSDNLPFVYMEGHVLDGMDGAVVDIDALHIQRFQRCPES